MLSADHDGLMLVPARTRPMSLKTEPALVAIAHQRVHLPAPSDHALADGAPERLVPVHRAILGMHVLNPRNRQHAAAFGENLLPGPPPRGRIPNHFSGRAIQPRQPPPPPRPRGRI